MLRVDNVDMSPRQLLQASASPQGPMSPPPAAQGGSETSRLASVGLMQQTFVQVNSSKVDGVGGRVDLLG